MTQRLFKQHDVSFNRSFILSKFHSIEVSFNRRFIELTFHLTTFHSNDASLIICFILKAFHSNNDDSDTNYFRRQTHRSSRCDWKCGNQMSTSSSWFNDATLWCVVMCAMFLIRFIALMALNHRCHRRRAKYFLIQAVSRFFRVSR